MPKYDLGGMSNGSDVNLDGLDVDRTAVKIPYQPNKKFGQNSGSLTATGYTEEPGEDMESGYAADGIPHLPLKKG